MKNSFPNSLECKLKDDDIVYYLHIPKTAGTSFIATLDSFFDYNSIYQEKVWHELLKKPHNDLGKYKLIRGHFGYNILPLLHKKPIYLTMLRDPIERTISQYEHIRRDRFGNNWVSKNFLAHNEMLEDLIKNENKRKRLGNSQTRYIGLDCDVLSFTKSMDNKSLGNFRFDENLPIFQTNTSDEMMLDTAKKRLEDFEFFGITENFDESMFLLFYTFGWKPIKSMWKLNVSAPRPHRKNLPDTIIKQIESWNRLDIEFYNFAKKIFEQRYLAMIEVLKEKYYQSCYASLSFKDIMFKMLNKNYEDRIDIKDEQLAESIDYDFTQKISGSGWYYREFLPQKRIAYRWTGPQTASIIDLPLRQDKKLVILFHVFVAAAPDILDSLSLNVNGHPIDLKITYTKEAGRYFEGILPKRILRNGKKFVRLKFMVNRTLNPHSVNPDDPMDRKIGAAFDRIEISPQKIIPKFLELIKNFEKMP